MTTTIAPPPAASAKDRERSGAAPTPRPEHPASHAESHVLARYTDSRGRPRDVLASPGVAGSLLVIDRDAATRGDRRLVAHLAPDEPPANAVLACRDYLRDPRRRWCRPLEPEDLRSAPFADDLPEEVELDTARLRDRNGRAHALRTVAGGPSRPELRWHRLPSGSDGGLPRPVSLRDVIATLESYEPARTLTARALLRHREDPAVSVATLAAELERMDASRIVLNRGLREAVQHAVRTQGLSMSEISLRCGRFKRDARGNSSGETSWLARRIGLMPEGGRGVSTPWVHSEVLALIARRGLGIGPREVELG